MRSRRRLRLGAAATLGSVAVVGVSGAALGTGAGVGLRATAGMQLVSLAAPLLTPADSEGPESVPGPAETAAASVQSAGAAVDPDADSKATRGDAAADAATADAGRAAEQAATAEQAAAEQAAEQAAAAAEQAAADQAAAEAASRAAVPVDDPAAAKAYAASSIAGRGWEASQLTCLDTLWTKESEWLTSATNASSGAYGIAQSLPAEKMAAAGTDYRVNYRTQINWGLDYISSRYGTPCSALNFHYANNWY